MEEGSSQFRAAYRAELQGLRVRAFRVACVLSLTIPFGALADMATYPEMAREFLHWRLEFTVFMLVLYAFSYTRLGQRIVGPMSVFYILLMNALFAAMIAVTEQALSPYFAGMMLVLLAATLILPWGILESLVVSLGSVAMYLAATMPFADPAIPHYSRELGLNTFFVGFTGFFCVVSGHLSTQFRRRNFALRYQLDARNRELLELDRLKSEFIGNISHELRTPLTLIKGPVENLLSSTPDLPGAVREDLDYVQRNTRRLSNLVDELLEVLRLEDPATPRRREAVDLRLLVRNVAANLHYNFQAREQELEVITNADPIWVLGDGANLEKVLVNILSNAAKFTPPRGQITLELNVNDDEAEITCRDTGCGIPEEELPKIFGRFYRGNSPGNYAPGTGIGLAFSQDVVRTHEGRIEVESQPGEGSVFRLILPIAAPEEIATAEVAEPTMARHSPWLPSTGGDEAPASNGSADMTDGNDLARSTLLLVDDEPDVLNFLRSRLAQDYRVLSAGSAEEGLRIFETDKPDLAILDWMLPGMTGRDLCIEMRRRDPQRLCRILMLTARIDEESKITGLREGADDFLTKPFSLLEIRTRLRNLEEAARLQRDLATRNRDLSEALENLRRTQAQLVEGEKTAALGTLAGGLLHEINNPLNFSLCALEHAREEAGEDAELAETLGDIETGFRRISRLIADLRTFAYPDTAGRVDGVELADVIDSALRLVNVRNSSVRVLQDVPRGVRVRGSRGHLVQVLTRVLSRAVDEALAGTAETPEVRVNGRTHRGKREMLVEVIDNGPTPASESLSRVFDPFHGSAPGDAHNGLSLSLCKSLVEAHGGTIEAAACPQNGGSLVKLRLPLQAARPILEKHFNNVS